MQVHLSGFHPKIDETIFVDFEVLFNITSGVCTKAGFFN